MGARVGAPDPVAAAGLELEWVQGIVPYLIRALAGSFDVTANIGSAVPLCCLDVIGDAKWPRGHPNRVFTEELCQLLVNPTARVVTLYAGDRVNQCGDRPTCPAFGADRADVYSAASPVL